MDKRRVSFTNMFSTLESHRAVKTSATSNNLFLLNSSFEFINDLYALGIVLNRAVKYYKTINTLSFFNLIITISY